MVFICGLSMLVLETLHKMRHSNQLTSTGCSKLIDEITKRVFQFHILPPTVAKGLHKYTCLIIHSYNSINIKPRLI